MRYYDPNARAHANRVSSTRYTLAHPWRTVRNPDPFADTNVYADSDGYPDAQRPRHRADPDGRDDHARSDWTHVADFHHSDPVARDYWRGADRGSHIAR